MRIYHGSDKIVERPTFGFGKATNDYGRGFYCTAEIDLAREWACPTRRDGYVNAYDVDLDALRVLDLNAPQYGILHWLAVLIRNRPVRLDSSVQEEGVAWIVERFSIDLSGFDAIRGHRADDSYFGFVRSFLENGISLAQLARAMKFGNLGEQIVAISPKAFGSLKFVASEAVPWKVYHFKRAERDEQARAAFRREVRERAAAGLYLVDILRENMDANDERLR